MHSIRPLIRVTGVLASVSVLLFMAWVQDNPAPSPEIILAGTVGRTLALVEPAPGSQPQLLSNSVRITQADGARRPMDRAVGMTSDIDSVLFALETLEFWMATADSENAAGHGWFTHYNLRELLRGDPASARPGPKP